MELGEVDLLLNSNALMLNMALLGVILFIFSGVFWLFFNHGIDKLKHPEEWKDAGSTGERIMYKTLVRKFKIPEGQIFRNVYIPRGNDKTSEMDLIVVSKKGIFVFECKNYGGNIYGDAGRSRWIQYIGREKNYFYSPLLQNKNHAKYLKGFLAQDEIEVPIIPLISTIARGNWKVRNLKRGDYVLGLNCHFEDIYEDLPDSKAMARNYRKIMTKLTPLVRLGEGGEGEACRGGVKR